MTITLVFATWILMPVAQHAAQDILFADLGFPDGIDQWHTSEYRRVAAICGTDQACFARTFTERAWVLNAVYGVPESDSPVLGHLVAVSYVAPSGRLPFRLDFRSRTGEQRTWVPDVGSWDYGIDLFPRGC
jgi:hypothetical protein